MRKLILTWAVLRLIWESKGFIMKEMPARLRAEFPGRKGFAFGSLQRHVKEHKPAPADVAEFILEKLEVRQGEEENAEIVRLGLTALRRGPTSNRQLPELALSLLARFPTDEQALKLADALIKRAGLGPGLLEQLVPAVEALITRAASDFGCGFNSIAASVLDKLDALATVASSTLGKLDALAASVFSVLGKLASTENKLDTAHGKLDGVHDKLDTLQASVSNLEAQVALLQATQARQASDNPKGSTGNPAGVLGMLTVALAITCHHSGPPAASAPRLASTDQDERTGRTEIAEHQKDFRSRSRAGSSMGTSKTGRPLPRTRLRWKGLDQAVAPCEGSETELYRLCWRLMGHSPPCPSDQFQEANKCYIPVYEVPDEPTSETGEAPIPEQR